MLFVSERRDGRIRRDPGSSPGRRGDRIGHERALTAGHWFGDLAVVRGRPRSLTGVSDRSVRRVQNVEQQARALDASGDRWEDLAAVLCLRHDRIRSGRASEAGHLVVEFESGATLAAAPSEMYESWAVSGPGFQLIALAGGGVAVFADGSK
ncbi:MAG: DUF6188 family protein [Solirubrobacteraceae bacterium]